ncbi:MAG: HupE/UreJ family protein [Mesorhizobium sp.]|uniref:HupE/UreJ family protein n=1 Tax=Mesorhizobium sp. TaxID=1871066 RepID=UPI00121706BE|nr:HupE/UreJ family protein [Mesorhizobium sp.]TIQ34102.1 MAG: HupE/UreJ family protein [Mesorhizobium sp.]
MIRSNPTKLAFVAIMLAAACKPALSHIGVGSANSFAAGLAHPFFGIDHIIVMVAVGLWAALKGGRALWALPAAFVSLMLAGGALGIAGVPVPLVEPVILASIVALGLLIATAVDLPVATGAVIIGFFALFHGHAHGTEIPETAGGLEYLAGFALATAFLHGAGIGFGLLPGQRIRGLVRLAGAATAVAGLGLMVGAV